MTNFILDAEKHGLYATPRRQQLKSAEGKQPRKLPLCGHKVHGNFLVLSYAYVVPCCDVLRQRCAMLCHDVLCFYFFDTPRVAPDWQAKVFL